jgi:hypothetical protein
MTRGCDPPGPNHSAMARTLCRADWETRGAPSPESTRKDRNLRTSHRSSASLKCRDFARISSLFESWHRTTENRGVPGSSPGLAIRNPTFQRDFLLFGWEWADRSLGTRLGTEPTIRSHRLGAEPRARAGFGVLLEIKTTRLRRVVSSVRHRGARRARSPPGPITLPASPTAVASGCSIPGRVDVDSEDGRVLRGGGGHDSR